MSADRPRRRRAELGFGLLVAVALLPLCAAHYLPIQDLPQHAAAVRVLHDFDTPRFAFQRFFELSLLSTQYLSVYLVGALLASVFGVVAALKLVIAVSIAALPYALRAVLRSLGKPGVYALFALPLTYNSQLMLGFLNFSAGLPLMFWGLKLALDLRRRRSWRAEVLLATVSLACFFTHVVPFAVLVVSAAAIALDREIKVVLRRVAPLGPALIAFALWSRWAPAGRVFSGLLSGGVASEGPPISVRIAELPLWLNDVLPGNADEIALCATLACIVATLICGRAGLKSFAPGTRRLFLLPPAAALAYFALPSSAGFIWPIHARFALLTLLLAIPLLPSITALPLRGVTALACLGTMLEAGAVFTAFRSVEREEEAGLREVLEELPFGVRVAGLIYDPSSRYLAFSPFLHAVAWAQVERGGAVMFTFAEFPISPFRFRAEQRPPAVPPRWEWLPSRVDTRRDLAFYDYVLTRRAPRRLPGWQRAHSGGDWALWRPEPRVAVGSGGFLNE